jgi:hypothetical protein
MWPPGATQSTVGELGNSITAAAKKTAAMPPNRPIRTLESPFMSIFSLAHIKKCLSLLQGGNKIMAFAWKS